MTFLPWLMANDMRLTLLMILVSELDCDIVVGAGFTREPPANFDWDSKFLVLLQLDQPKGYSPS
jgi:hypothetical protein